MGSIFVRITDVITANINEMIDKVEDPSRMIKQIISEMEENIQKAKNGVLDAITSEKQLAKELESQRQKASAWKEKAEDSLRAGNENLARESLKRKKDHELIAKDLEISWEAAKATSDALK